jgi:hypothetical protein
MWSNRTPVQPAHDLSTRLADEGFIGILSHPLTLTYAPSTSKWYPTYEVVESRGNTDNGEALSFH